MTITHRIITTAAVMISLAAAGAPTAAARPAYDPPTSDRQTPASVYSRPDESMLPVAASASGAIAPKTSVPQSLTRQQRQRVAALSALSDKQLAAGFGVAPPIANTDGAPQGVVRVQMPQSGFDWGDAGIGAAAGLALASLGVGGALVFSRQRPRRARPSTTLPN